MCSEDTEWKNAARRREKVLKVEEESAMAGTPRYSPFHMPANCDLGRRLSYEAIALGESARIEQDGTR